MSKLQKWIVIFSLIILVLSPSWSRSSSNNYDECVLQDLADLAPHIIEKASNKVLEETLGHAGREILSELRKVYNESARQGFQDLSPGTTLPMIVALQNFDKVHDLLAPLEAFAAGDYENAGWSFLSWTGTESVKATIKQSLTQQLSNEAITQFAMNDVLATEAMIGLRANILTAAIVGTAQICLASFRELHQQDCLLEEDLSYYAFLEDPELNPSNLNRVTHYIRNYIGGEGVSPWGIDRRRHRKQLQCFIDTQLSGVNYKIYYPNVSKSDPRYATEIMASSTIGQTVNSSPQLRSAIMSMLRDFDIRKKLDEQRRKAHAFLKDPKIRTLYEASKIISNYPDLPDWICQETARQAVNEGYVMVPEVMNSHISDAIKTLKDYRLNAHKIPKGSSPTFLLANKVVGQDPQEGKFRRQGDFVTIWYYTDKVPRDKIIDPQPPVNIQTGYYRNTIGDSGYIENLGGGKYKISLWQGKKREPESNNWYNTGTGTMGRDGLIHSVQPAVEGHPSSEYTFEGYWKIIDSGTMKLVKYRNYLKKSPPKSDALGWQVGPVYKLVTR